MIALTPTTFAGGVEEALSAVDVCSQSGELFSGLSELQVSISNVGSLSDELGSISLELPTIPTIINQAGEVALDPSAITSNLSGVASQSYSAIQTASSDIKGALTQVNGLSTQITTQIAGVKSTINNIKTQGVASLFSAVSGVIDPNIAASMKDVASTVAMGTNLIKQARKMGVGGVLTAVSSSSMFQGSPLQQIAQQVLPAIKLAGDVKAYVELAKTQGPAMLSTALAPTLGMDVLANYKSIKNDIQTVKSQVTAVKTEIKQTKQQLVGEWNSFKLATVALKTDILNTKKIIKKELTDTKSEIKSVFSAKTLLNATKDAKTLVKAKVDNTTRIKSIEISKLPPLEIINEIMKPPDIEPEQIIYPVIDPVITEKPIEIPVVAVLMKEDQPPKPNVPIVEVVEKDQNIKEIPQPVVIKNELSIEERAAERINKRNILAQSFMKSMKFSKAEAALLNEKLNNYNTYDKLNMWPRSMDFFDCRTEVANIIYAMRDVR